MSRAVRANQIDCAHQTSQKPATPLYGAEIPHVKLAIELACVQDRCVLHKDEQSDSYNQYGDQGPRWGIEIP